MRQRRDKSADDARQGIRAQRMGVSPNAPHLTLGANHMAARYVESGLSLTQSPEPVRLLTSCVPATGTLSLAPMGADVTLLGDKRSSENRTRSTDAGIVGTRHVAYVIALWFGARGL